MFDTVRIESLWRYPVKSFGGERLDSVTIGRRGIEGDRRWGLADPASDLMFTARRVPELLFGSARLVDGGVELTRRDGDRFVVAVGNESRADAWLADWLGFRVHLVASTERRGKYENPTDFENEASGRWTTWRGPAGTFHDSARTRVSVVSRSTLGEWDPRRFRANVVLDAHPARVEDGWIGEHVRLGADVVLDVRKQIDRCVMTTRPQAGGIERDLDVLRAVNRDHDGNLGIGCLVVRSGEVRVGDDVQVGDLDAVTR